MEEEIKQELDIALLIDFIEAVGEEYEVVREKQALENLINRYKKLEESKITFERVKEIQETNKRIVIEKYILKSKVEEKINSKIIALKDSHIDNILKCEFTRLRDELLKE